MTELADFHLAQQSEDQSVLTELSRSSDPTIRSYVAENPHTHLNVLKRLMSDPIAHVCIYVLRNPKVTNDMCRILTVHSDKLVQREAVLLAIRRYKRGLFPLEQKELFSYIKIIDPTANNLDAIEALVELNEASDRMTNA